MFSSTSTRLEKLQDFSSWAWLCKKSQLPTTFEEKTWVQCKWVRKIESHFFKAQTSDLSHFWMGCFEPLWGFQPVGPLRWWLRRKAERKVQGADGGGTLKALRPRTWIPRVPTFPQQIWKALESVVTPVTPEGCEDPFLDQIMLPAPIRKLTNHDKPTWQMVNCQLRSRLVILWPLEGSHPYSQEEGTPYHSPGLHSAWKPPKTTPHLIKTWITITKNQCA
jgi:hypothetical protein